MSDKVKKEATGLSFSISKLFSRISTMKPSSVVVSAVVMGVAVFLLGGGVYDIINQPFAAIYYNSRFYFLYPSLNEQFIFDTVVSGILYITGFIGLITMFQSSRHAYNPRQAYMMMIIGVTLVFLSYLFIEYFIGLKIAGK
jgi:hypothetical protein